MQCKQATGTAAIRQERSHRRHRLSEIKLLFDITNETKKNGAMTKADRQSITAFLLKTANENNGTNYIILSNDSTLYNNYTEIKIKE